jgi:hypothetical protein
LDSRSQPSGEAKKTKMCFNLLATPADSWLLAPEFSAGQKRLFTFLHQFSFTTSSKIEAFL